MADQNKDKLYSLIPLEEYKVLQGIDDRDDKIARFCLETSTTSIEHYCKRIFLHKKYFETVEFYGDKTIPLREYPVSKVLATFAINDINIAGEIIEPGYYCLFPNEGIVLDIPYCLSLSLALQHYRGLKAIKAVYWAGYKNIPQDLNAACMELASWNLRRYKGRCVGLTANTRGNGRDAEHFELSMPSQVKQLLEPYRRKVI